MLPEQQSRLVTVLVRARNPSNIGAVARAMNDLGYEHLRVVNDFHAPFEAAQLESAQKSAVHSHEILTNANQTDSLAEAVADCTLVLGTTAVGARVLEQPLYTLAEATRNIHEHLASNSKGKVALLFGSEKTGLSNEELSHCHALLTIPMNIRTAPRHLSMNLGQAAAVCLYTIAQAPSDVGLRRQEAVHQGLKPTDSARPIGTTEVVPLTSSGIYTKPAPSRESAPGSEPGLSTAATQEPATSAEEERLTTLLLEVLAKSDYSRRHPANSREPVIRRLVRRMANSTNDASVWAGILRQLLHSLKDTTTTP